MSIHWINYFFRSTDLDGSDLLVALAVADHANDAGLAFPGIETIAGMVRLKRRQVQYIFKRLEVAGYMQKTESHGRGKLTKIQLINVQSSAPFKPLENVQSNARLITENVQSSAPFTENKTCILASENVHSGVKKEGALRIEPLRVLQVRNKIPTPSGENPPIETDDRTYIFRTGLELLIKSGLIEKSARSILGKWRSKYGDKKTADAIRDAVRIDATVPVEYVAAILAKRPADLFVGKADTEPDAPVADPECFLCNGTGAVSIVVDPDAAFDWAKFGTRNCPDCLGGAITDAGPTVVRSSGVSPTHNLQTPAD